MKFERNCKTCEYCVAGENGIYKCKSINHDSPTIVNIEQEKPCWKISIKDWSNLVSLLPFNLREIYVNEVGGRAEKALFEEFHADNSTDLLINMVERVSEH